jgi:hypothetical protein
LEAGVVWAQVLKEVERDACMQLKIGDMQDSACMQREADGMQGGYGRGKLMRKNNPEIRVREAASD